MAYKNRRQSANQWLILFATVVCLTLLAACGASTSVKGTILDSTGKPFAGKTMILIPLLPEDRVKVSSLRVGGIMTLVVPLTEWKYPDDIVYERDGRGLPKWTADTNDAGDFVIGGMPPGKYVLLWLGAGAVGRTVYRIGAGEGFIRIEVQEGQTYDLGRLTLLNFSEPIVK